MRQLDWRGCRIALVVLTLAMIALFHSSEMVDDAYITFRHAFNLMHSGQLVFNVGERLEAQTNLLWSLILTPLTIFPEQIGIGVYVLSVLCLLWMGLRLTQLAEAMRVTPLAALGAIGLIVLSLSFIRAETSGLETPLLAALSAEILLRFSRWQMRLAFLFAGLAFMTRPDAGLIGLALAAAASMAKQPRKTVLTGLGIWLAVIGATTLFRLWAYGSPLPNSVVAKSLGVGDVLHQGRQSLRYLFHFAMDCAPLVLATALSAVLLIRSGRTSSTTQALGWLSLLVLSASVIVVLRNGGDWMPDHRLLIQYAPFYVALMLWLLSADGPKRHSSLARPVLAAAVALQLGLVMVESASLGSVSPFGYDPRERETFYGDPAARLAGRLAPNDRIAAEALGEISYALLRNPFHDPLGLADYWIARHGQPVPPYGKADINYTVQQVRPSVMFWHALYHFSRQLDPTAWADYEMRCLKLCDAVDDTMWIVMIRRDRLGDLGPPFAGFPLVVARQGRLEALRAP